MVWNFSTDAYLNFLFQRDIFDGTLQFSPDYLLIYLRSFIFAVATTVDLPAAGLPDRLFHGDAAAVRSATGGCC